MAKKGRLGVKSKQALASKYRPLRKIAKAVRYVALARVASSPKDRRILSNAAGDLFEEITAHFLKDPYILKPLETIGQDFDEDFDDMDDDLGIGIDEVDITDDLDDELDDNLEDDDLIDTEVIDDFEEPMIAADEDDEDADVIVVEDDDEAENIGDEDESEDEAEESEDEGDESDEEEESYEEDESGEAEASYIPNKTRRRAIATANRLAATGDRNTRKIAQNIMRRIVQ